MSELIGKIKEKGIRQSVRMISVKMKKQEKWDVKNLRGKRKNAIDKLLSREFDTVFLRTILGFTISCFSVPSI